jgi:hypothetical protein
MITRNTLPPAAGGWIHVDPESVVSGTGIGDNLGDCRQNNLGSIRRYWTDLCYRCEGINVAIPIGCQFLIGYHDTLVWIVPRKET